MPRGAVGSALTGAGGVIIGATLSALGITLLPRLFRRRGEKKQKGTDGEATPALYPTPGVVFGSPVEAKNSKNSSKNSTGPPGTPLAKSGKPPRAAGDAAKARDQGGLSGAPAAAQDASSIQQQLQMLKAVEEENKRLKEFMSAHMQTSQKVQTLEEENQVLKKLQSKLQGELEDIKAKAAAPFALSSGDELQSFKQMLATRMPLEARSVCSDAFGLGGAPRDTAASVDGAATVAEFAAVRKRAPGWFSELASMLTMAPAAAAARAPVPSGVATPGGPTTPRSAYGGSVLGASSPMPSRQASVAQPPQGKGQQDAVAPDVGLLLETWAGGRL